MKNLIRIIGALIVLAAVAFVGVFAFNRFSYQIAVANSPATPPATQAQIARGKYLAVLADCAACHTAEGGQPYAGGLRLNTGFGYVAAANITPDTATGIGGWTTAQFILAVRHGIGDHGKRLYPAMPYNDYAKMTDQDVADIKAYLDTVPAVNNEVIANQMPFPFDMRMAMMGWNLLFFDDAVYKNDDQQSAEWNRGAYLVQGAGHCATCHTGKNLLGGDIASQSLRGNIIEGWYAPDLTETQPVGLASWSTQDIVAYLGTGSNDHVVAAGPMAEAVHDSTQHWTQQDLQATATYLKSLPGAPAPAVATADPAVVAQGQTLYEANCAACHNSAGTGVPGMVPAFAGSAAIQAPTAVNIIHTILYGGRAVETDSNPTAAQMPGFAWKLNDDQVAALATYLRSGWGNKAAPVAAADVAKQRTQTGS